MHKLHYLPLSTKKGKGNDRTVLASIRIVHVSASTLFDIRAKMVLYQKQLCSLSETALFSIKNTSILYRKRIDSLSESPRLDIGTNVLI